MVNTFKCFLNSENADHIIARQEQKVVCIKLPGPTDPLHSIVFRGSVLTREKMQNGFMTAGALLLSSIPLVFAA